MKPDTAMSPNSHDSKGNPVPPQTSQGAFALTDQQQAYFVGRNSDMEPGGLTTHGYVELECADFSYERFTSAVNTLIQRHPVLRTRFLENGRQEVLEHAADMDIPQRDLSRLAAGEAEKRIAETRDGWTRQMMDYSKPPLIRFCVNMHPSGKTVIQFYFDSLIMDGLSHYIFLRELDALYCGQSCEPEQPQSRFSDYVQYKEEQKQSDAYRAAKAFWEEKIPTLPEPAELPAPAVKREQTGPSGKQLSYRMTAKQWETLRENAKKHGLSGFILLFSAFAKVMARWSYQQEFLLCVPVSDRPRFSGEFDRLVGECSSFLLFPVKNKREESFEDFAKTMRHELRTLKENQTFSGLDVLRAMNRQSGRAGGSVVPVVFTSLLDLPEQERRQLHTRYFESHTSQIALETVVSAYADEVHIAWNYVEDMIDETVLRDMLEAFGLLMERLMDEDWSFREIALPERNLRLMRELNDTRKDYTFDSLIRLLDRSFETNRGRKAVGTLHGAYTYEETQARAKGIAAALRAAGKGPGAVVCVLLEKGPCQIFSVVGCLYAGMVYMPLEYDSPLERIRSCIENAGCDILITDAAMKEKAGAFAGHVLCVSEETCPTCQEAETVSGGELAAIIHTSGSTGMPKAVMVTERGLLNSLFASQELFVLTSEDCAIQVTNLAHDMSMFDIFGMLLCGGAVAVPDAQGKKDPAHWIALMRRHKVTIWNSVPAMMEMLLEVMEFSGEAALADLRTAIVGGDYVSAEIPGRLRLAAPNCKLFSVGGPTETTLWNIYHPVGREDEQAGVIPYGRPIANNRYYLFNENLELVPVGVTGMMYCGGIGVTKGYLGAPEETAKKYILHPETGEHLYQTGDMGKYRPDGAIAFSGRQDGQVKILGKRIETEEIEQTLRKMPNILACAVCVDRDTRRIAAFYKLKDASQEVSQQEFQAHMTRYLPDYMLPSAYLEIPEIPLTRNGKVDRNALLAQFRLEKTDSRPHSLTGREEELRDLIAGLTGISLSSADENFYMAGGDSMKAISLIHGITQTYRTEIPLAPFMEEPTLHTLSRLMNRSEERETFVFTPEPEKKWEPFELSELQQAYVVGRKQEIELGRMATHGYVELSCTAYDHERFCTALKRVFQRHEVLRDCIMPDGYQYFEKELPEIRVPLFDLSQKGEEEIREAIEEMRGSMVCTVLPLAKAPMLFANVHLLPQGRALIHIYFDTLILDGWSYQIFLDDLEMFYADTACEPEPLQITYRDYIQHKFAFRRTKKYRQAKQFWLDRIPELPPAATLPLLRQPAELTEMQGFQKECKLTMDEWEHLKEKAGRHGVSPFIALFTSFSLVIARWNCRRRFLLSLPEFDRMEFHPDVRQMLGECSSFLLFTVERNPGDSFLEMAMRNQQQLWKLKEHNCFTGVEVLREVYKYKGRYGTAMVPIVFSTILDLPQKERKLLRPVFTETHTTQVWIDIDVQLCNGEIQFNWNSIKGLLDEDMLEEMVQLQMKILREAAFSDACWDETLQIPLSAEDRRISGQINETARRNAVLPPLLASLENCGADAKVRERWRKPLAEGPWYVVNELMETVPAQVEGILCVPAGADTETARLAGGAVVCRTDFTAKYTKHGELLITGCRAEGEPPEKRPAKQADPAYAIGDVGTGVLKAAADIIGVARVDISDHFFMAGGDSLKAIKLSNRLKSEFGVEYPITRLFEEPEMEALVKAVELAVKEKTGEPEGHDLESFLRDDREEGAPSGAGTLSLQQQGIWLYQQFYLSDAFTLSAFLKIDGPLDTENLHRAIGAVVQRHDALRSYVELDEKQLPRLVVREQSKPEVEHCQLKPGETSQEAAYRIVKRYQDNMSVEQNGKPVGFALIEEDAGRHMLVIVIHHLFSDEISFQIIARDIAQCYAAFSSGEAPELKPVPQYRDFARWQVRHMRREEDLDFWKKSLHSGMQYLELPGSASCKRGAEKGKLAPVAVSAEKLTRLRKLCRERHGSLYMGFAALFTAFLAEQTGEREITVGTPVACRNETGLEDVVGLFVNETLLVGTVREEDSFLDLLVRTQVVVTQTIAHSSLPFETVLSRLRLEKLSGLPFHIHFSYIEEKGLEEEKAGLRFHALEYAKDQIMSDFGLYVENIGGAFYCALAYKESYMPETAAADYAGSFARLIERALEDPERVMGIPGKTENSPQDALADYFQFD